MEATSPHDHDVKHQFKQTNKAIRVCEVEELSILKVETNSPQTNIRKTCPCNVYPLIPHFYIAKLGYAGVYLFFLFLLQNTDCGYSLEPPRRGGSNVYPQSMF